MSIRPNQVSNAGPATPTQRIGAPGQTAPVQGPGFAADARVAAAPGAQAPVTVEANGRLGDAGTLAVSGRVGLSRVFMERLLRQLTNNPARFGRTSLAFDPASRSYRGNVQVRVAGLRLSLSGGILPTLEQNQPGFRIVRPGLRLGPWTVHPPGLGWAVTHLIARAISNQPLQAKALPGGLVRLDTNGLLHAINVLPYDVALDGQQTRMALAVDGQGGVNVELTTPGLSGPSGPRSGRSELGLTLSETALYQRLQPLLAPDFLLKRVAIADQSVVLHGTAEAKDASDVVNGLRGVLGLIALAESGRPPHLEPERVMVPLDLSARIEGHEVVLTPSIGQAIDPLEQTLTKAGAKPRREGKSLRFDLIALGSHYGLSAVDASPGQVALRANLDLSTLFGSPILRGEP